MTMDAPNAVERLARVLDAARTRYAIIGGHAVNSWLEPRFTADIDVTVAADVAELTRLRDLLSQSGYVVTREYGADLPSGPDFVRWTSSEGDVVELQLAKTEFQEQVIRRAVVGSRGAKVATPEDLVVLKLIADRAKDRIDLEGLVALESLDWAYVEHWARQWDVLDRLERVRAGR